MRTGQWRQFQESVWNIMKPEYDCVIARFWNEQKGIGVSEETFIRTNADIIDLFTPSAGLMKVARAKGKYESVIDEVSAAMSDAYFAKVMHGCAISVVAYGRFKEEIEMAVKATENEGFSEEACSDFNQMAERCVTMFLNTEGVKEFGERSVSIEFWGATCQIKCWDYPSECQLRLAARMMMFLVKHGWVWAYPWEKELVAGQCEDPFVRDGEPKDPPVSIARDFFTQLSNARLTMRDMLLPYKNKSLGENVGFMVKNSKAILKAHRALQLDCSFAQLHAEASLDNQLRGRIEEAFPTQDVTEAPDPSHTYTKCMELKTSSLAMLCSGAVRSDLETILNILRGIKKGEAPQRPEARTSQFMASILGRCANFATFDVEEVIGGIARKTTITGRAAMLALMDDLDADTSTNPRDILDKVQRIQPYSWVLVGGEYEKLKTLCDAAYQKLGKEMAIVPARSASGNHPSSRLALTLAGASSSSSASSKAAAKSKGKKDGKTKEEKEALADQKLMEELEENF